MEIKTENNILEQFGEARHDRRRLVIEGFHAIKHALRFGAQISLTVCRDPQQMRHMVATLAPDIGAQLESGCNVISPGLFERLGSRRVDTGMLAIATRPAFDIGAVMGTTRRAPTIIVERTAHPGNLGAVIRSSAAAGAHAVLALGDDDPWQAGALRGSAGLHFALPVGRIDPDDLQNDMARPLWAIHPEGEDLALLTIPDDVLLAFGSERQGLSSELLALADRRVAIPMQQGVSSLNLAASAAVLLYHWRLQAC
ncbi:MAG: hypothetical protein KDG54_11870 [Geminicoccaceae bacterium]|nr:hypothetical protein [Geminicoccaceae bacterium]